MLLVHVTSAVALPECPGSYDNTTWTNCEGAYVWPDGRKYEGEFESVKFHGQGTYTFVTGSNYVGEFKDGRYDGQGTYTYVNGSKYLGEFKNGSYDGKGTLTHADGTVESGIWEHGERKAENKSFEQTRINHFN